MSKGNDKPVFDEQTLAKVLEAAYVLQEHHRTQRPPNQKQDHRKAVPAAEPRVATPPVPSPVLPPAKESHPVAPSLEDAYALTLAQIVETQRQIHDRDFDLERALSLVAERVTPIAKGGGAGIALREGDKVRYRAAAGLMTLPAGTEVPLEKALCLECLRTGQVIRCEDVNPEFLLDAAECRRRGIQSIIAVPIYREGGIAGALEVYYATTQAFTEQDVHTCQLMAGVVTEALARSQESASKEAVSNESTASVEARQAAMLAALEELKPDLYTLVDKHVTADASPRTAALSAESSPAFVCRKCGHQLVGEEQFCGNCGSPRSHEYQPPSLQSKVAALWRMQEATKKSAPAPPTKSDAVPEPTTAIPEPLVRERMEFARPEEPMADSIEEAMPEFFATPEFRMGAESSDPPGTVHREPIEVSSPPVIEIPLEAEAEMAEAVESKATEETALARPEPVANWTSAAAARDFLEQLAAGRRQGTFAQFWNARRGDIYLAVAVILVAGVIRWGIWSSHSVSAKGGPPATVHHKTDPNADLSLFDRMLIGLGLAEAPPPQEYKGNPETQVWVDLHTALYYCPGTDLYGKTEKGHFTTQRSAQLDQFEPAYRKACD